MTWLLLVGIAGTLVSAAVLIARLDYPQARRRGRNP